MLLREQTTRKPTTTHPNQGVTLRNPSPIWRIQKETCTPVSCQMAMGQNPNRTVPPVNIPIPTQKDSKMGGEFTYQPKWDPISFDNHSQMGMPQN